MTYQNIPININFNPEESKKHLPADYEALMARGVDNLIREKFIPWLLDPDFQDRNPEKVFAGLKIYEITYHYGKIVAQYSPTGEENYFGQFEFCFEGCNDYTKDILEAAAMEIYIMDGEVVKVGEYDI